MDNVSLQFKNFADVLLNHAKEYPEDLACKFYHKDKEELYTYCELDKQAKKIASVIQRYCSKSDRVLLLMPVGLEYIAAFWACIYAGVIAVPAYPPRNNHHNQRLQALMNDADASLILTMTNVQQFIISPVKKILVNEILVTDGENFQPVSLQPDDLVFLQYTSGSTGDPKGVMVTHKNLFNNVEIIANIILSITEIRVCSCLPPYHDMGLIGGILMPIYKHAPIFLLNPNTFLTNPMRWLEIISKNKITASPAPNFVYDLCVTAANKNPPTNLDLSSWKIAFNGAEPIRAETLKRFTETFAPFNFDPNAMTPCYGMAETTLIASCKKSGMITKQLQINKQLLEKDKIVSEKEISNNSTLLTSSGKSVIGHKLIIIDPANKQNLPDYNVGEICVAGPSVTQGYWRKPELNAMSFIGKRGREDYPYFCTGDLGCLDEEGNLYVTGRIKDLIIIRGRNLYPQDIEACVSTSHPGLIAYGCAAFSMEIANKEQLVVVQEVNRHQKDFALLYQQILRNLFNQYEIYPAQIILIQQASLPRTSSGKVQHNYCKQLLSSNELRIIDRWETKSVEQDYDFIENEFDKPKNIDDIMKWLCTWTARQCGAEIKITDRIAAFSHLGFDSLRAHQLCVDLSKWIKLDIDRAALWKCATIAKFAEYVGNELGFTSTEKELEIA